MDFVVESQPPLRVIVVSPKRGCCMCVKRTSRRVVARRREDHEIFIIVYEESYGVGCCPHKSPGQAVDFIFIMSSCVKADADDNNLLVFGGELLRPIFMTYDVPTTERRHTLTRCDMKCQKILCSYVFMGDANNGEIRKLFWVRLIIQPLSDLY